MRLAHRATVLETERLRPPIPIFYRMARNDFRFCGAQVPAYTLCVHPIALTHFLEEVYPEPLSFLPERHLQRTWSQSVIGTFGGGTHLCLGHNLAHIQTPLALAALLKHYDYELLEMPSLDYVLDPVTTPIEKSISIELRSRAAPRSTT
jgi:cytochrome P450